MLKLGILQPPYVCLLCWHGSNGCQQTLTACKMLQPLAASHLLPMVL
jgi:hypothetical protein